MAEYRTKKMSTAQARRGKVKSKKSCFVSGDSRTGKFVAAVSGEHAAPKGVFRVEENRKGFDTTRVFEKLGLIETSSDNGKKK